MVQANCREWKPKCGHTRAILVVVLMALIGAFLFAFAVQAFSQDGSAMEPFDWRGLAAAMIPAVWAGLAPITVKYITWGINLAGPYVPRYVQVPIAGALGILASAWTGDVQTVATTIATGGVAQTYAATEPHKMRADPPPQGQP